MGVGFARVRSGEVVKAGEQTARLEMNPMGALVVASDFTQRQAAGKPVTVVKGISVTNEAKEAPLGWRGHYRRRSASLGGPRETKGWAFSYKGEGENRSPWSPLTRATPKRRTEGPGRQSSVRSVAPQPATGAVDGYTNSLDGEQARFG